MRRVVKKLHNCVLYSKKIVLVVPWSPTLNSSLSMVVLMLFFFVHEISQTFNNFIFKQNCFRICSFQFVVATWLD